jgi:hypothetical protein
MIDYSSEQKRLMMYKDFLIISSCHLMKWFFDIPVPQKKNEMMWSPSVFDDICDVPGRANIVVKERKKEKKAIKGRKHINARNQQQCLKRAVAIKH